MVFLISTRIVLYRHREFGHHLGTKVAKIIVVLSALTDEKACICKDFHSSRLLDGVKSNTIFYKGEFNHGTGKEKQDGNDGNEGTGIQHVAAHDGLAAGAVPLQHR